jgi:hypothetical protein
MAYVLGFSYHETYKYTPKNLIEDANLAKGEGFSFQKTNLKVRIPKILAGADLVSELRKSGMKNFKSP